MNWKPQISVLVPVYNSEKYIKRCIESVLTQTFPDFELILVDDGSTDSSGKLCDAYAVQDKRVRVYHKPNEGISATREFAVCHAEGEYIQFVDSDDWVEDDMLFKLYGKANESNADIVGCNFIQEFDDRQIKTEAIYQTKDAFLRSVIGNYWGVLWKILIRRELFSQYNIHFPKGIDGGEDYFVVVSLLLNCKNVSFVDFYPYHYIRNNTNSFISSPTIERLMYQVKATDMVENLFNTHGVTELYKKEINKRKVATKFPVMHIDFSKGVKLYGKLPFPAIRYAKGKRNKIYFLIAYLYMIF